MVALIAFITSIALATWVLLPKENLIFSVHGSALYEDEIRNDVFEIAETHRRLAYWLDGYHAVNELKLRRLFACYRWSTVALLGEVLFWCLQLAVS